MPHISVLKSSKFLTKADFEQPQLLTITGCTEMNVAKEGAPEEYRWCLHFSEVEKPMVLNSTNGQIIAGFIGNDNTDFWKGHKVVLYHDPNVSFGGKLIGGIRARAPRIPQAKPAPAPTAIEPSGNRVTTLPPSQHPPAAQPPPWPTQPVPIGGQALAQTLAPVAEEDEVPF